LKVQGKNYRSIWEDAQSGSVMVIDQRTLPHSLRICSLDSLEQCLRAIKEMWVRGAPLIGATAAYGLVLAIDDGMKAEDLDGVCKRLLATRPTAVNLSWALKRMRRSLMAAPETTWQDLARREARLICDEDVEVNQEIGRHGKNTLHDIWRAKNTKEPLRVLTHCNAGWLATVDWGTALAPVYQLHREGVPLHVWVDETRPRNQGSSLTAWELGAEGVPHSVIVDNAGGHLMQHGMVDACIVGSDRTTRRGDVCNKIGTYLKALAAKDNGVPFYVALPTSTIDWSMGDGVAEIPIEERHADEIHFIGRDENKIRLTPATSHAVNYGFDVTPARLVDALITEKGVIGANEDELLTLSDQIRGAKPSDA
jgi:methylthioribose-1-phosphate isomerase